MLQSYSRTTRINKKLMRESVNHKSTPRAWSDYGSPKKKQGPGFHNRGKFGREKKTGETTWVHYSKVYSLHASTGVCKAVLPERSCSSEAASFLES